MWFIINTYNVFLWTVLLIETELVFYIFLWITRLSQKEKGDVRGHRRVDFLKDTIITKDTIGYEQQKNNSPILGRCGYTEDGLNFYFGGNYGSFAEYHSYVNSKYEETYSELQRDGFFELTLEYDVNNIWVVIDEAPYCVLRNSR